MLSSCEEGAGAEAKLPSICGPWRRKGVQASSEDSQAAVEGGAQEIFT